MKALVGAFNQEKALVGAFSMIVQPVVEPMENYTALVIILLIISVVTTTALNTGLRGPLSGPGLLRATRGCPKIKKTEKVFHHQKFWCLPKFLLITRVSD